MRNPECVYLFFTIEHEHFLSSLGLVDKSIHMYFDELGSCDNLVWACFMFTITRHILLWSSICLIYFLISLS